MHDYQKMESGLTVPPIFHPTAMLRLPTVMTLMEQALNWSRCLTDMEILKKHNRYNVGDVIVFRGRRI